VTGASAVAPLLWVVRFGWCSSGWPLCWVLRSMWSGRSGEPVRHLGAEAVIGRWLVHLTGLVFPVDVAARRRTVLVRMDGTARRRWARRSKVLC